MPLILLFLTFKALISGGSIWWNCNFAITHVIITNTYYTPLLLTWFILNSLQFFSDHQGKTVLQLYFAQCRSTALHRLNYSMFVAAWFWPLTRHRSPDSRRWNVWLSYIEQLFTSTFLCSSQNVWQEVLSMALADPCKSYFKYKETICCIVNFEFPKNIFCCFCLDNQ